MSTSATAAPSAANACAAARPIPEPAPVTSATLFSKDKFIGRFLLHLMCLPARSLGLGPVLRRFECRRAFPERPCRPHFRCTHRRSALAERANLLAKYARSVQRVVPVNCILFLMSKYGGARKGDARVTTRLETISEPVALRTGY